MTTPGSENSETPEELPTPELEVEDLLEWRDYIERMALDFIEGRADVDPREFPATCDSCGLQAVCRIAELRTRLDDEDKNGEEQEGA